ncbi:MAG: nucleoside-diphosphate sugar epimerase/dehydratase [Dethiobacteria bacterium]|nr:nucleoside-diphosphate sugar epimerase/dehydratase [Dethiobacteria bacterium]
MLKGNGNLKNLGLATLDGGLVMLAIVISFYLRFDWVIPKAWLAELERAMLPVVLINLATYFAIGFYRRAWRYTSVDDLFLVMMAVTAGIGLTYVYGLFFIALPRSVYIITWLLLLLMVGGSRVAIRLLADYLSRPAGTGKKHKAVIVGAGEAGVLVARELKKHSSALAIRVIGFIDDDLSKHKQVIQGLPVLGGSADLPEVVQRYNLAEVIIAMPSAPYRVLQAIIASCADLPVQIKTVPGIFEIVKGQVSISALKEVEIEDLLQRVPVEVDVTSIADYLAGQVVLVTGAGGSIGSELCRQIAELNPAKLLILDHDENGIFYCHLDLQKLHPELIVVPLVRDIQTRAGLNAVFEHYRPAVVFHAAAYKHVPLMEANVEEVVRNNIEGSKNVIDLAEEYGVKRFVSISTDKAVNPSSVMGASKRVVEIYLQGKARVCNGTVFCAVRFGNVLGSQGSVVEIFRRQIAGGGPVTVTDPEMKRYFMTIPEAVQLVIQAGALGRGGEIYVLDMGEPVKIVDLARDMIILSGLKPERDIAIEFSGLRPGEKLYEELFSDRENFALTRHERIFIAPDTALGKEEISRELEALGKMLGRCDLAEVLET